jgi:acyl-coenzyme A thioesterase PaaI-like protein
MDPASLRSAGWTAIELESFSGQVAPLWIHGTGAEITVGFFAEARHTNNHIHTIHGGALMTFADVALGYAVVQALGAANCATAQLQIHFVAAAKKGEFISCRPEIVRRSAQLVFMRGLIVAGEKTVASVDGIWKVLEPRTARA